jgi:ADP-heptose:LPS heptosyltransferase
MTKIIALIHRCTFLISGDTGPMHIAAAVGTPYLALFGATPAKGRAPLTGKGLVLQHPVPCGPCDK